MKTNSIQITVTVVALAWACNLPAQYARDWYAIGGGGFSSGGGQAGHSKFSVNGTVGQPDANNSAGGEYLAQGAFMPAFIKTVLPPLHITGSGASIIAQWPDLCPGIHLEASSSLVATQWADLGTGSVSGLDRLVSVAATGNYRFFRLRKDCPK